MIDIRHIHFRYHAEPVLQDIHCQIHVGNFVALVGPNGSGKSTLIKCLCGILKTQKGEILIDGQSIEKYSPIQLAQTIAYIPQKEEGNQPITVFDTVLAGRKPYIRWKPSSHDYEEVADIFNQLGIRELSMRYMHELSGGQQQIVMIARAFAQKTRFLLMDEPIAHLDIRHQLEVMDVLKMLPAQGLTIIISLHDINMAIHYAEHFMMLNEGKIFAYGTKEIITQERIEQLYHIKAKIIQIDDFAHVFPCGKQPL